MWKFATKKKQIEKENTQPNTSAAIAPPNNVEDMLSLPSIELISLVFIVVQKADSLTAQSLPCEWSCADQSELDYYVLGS